MNRNVKIEWRKLKQEIEKKNVYNEDEKLQTKIGYKC